MAAEAVASAFHGISRKELPFMEALRRELAW
jgi:hypothetical protein